MAKRSRKSSGRGPRRQGGSRKSASRPTTIKHDLAVLRKAGIIGKRALRGKPSGAAYRLANRYRDVIEGKAVAVKPRTRLVPKALRKAGRERRGRIVVPKPPGTRATNITLKRERGKEPHVIITRSRRMPNGQIIREQVVSLDIIDRELPPGKIYRITMPNWQSSYYARNYDGLENFMDFSSTLREWADISIINESDMGRAYGVL